jgi:hypothetical protein
MKTSAIAVVAILGLVGCRHQDEQCLDPVGLLRKETFWWDYAYSSAFCDGGSIAYGFINGEGEILYVFAYCPMQSPERRLLVLKRSFNGRSCEIVAGSPLEAEVMKLVEEANEDPSRQHCQPPLAELKAMLRDRMAPFPDWPVRAPAQKI